MAGRSGDHDRRDRRDATRIAIALVGLAVLVGIILLIAGPAVQGFIGDSLAPGVGVKSAFIWGFGLTFAVFVVFALVSGDGVVGELPVMLGGFLVFWLIFSFSVAWIF